MSFSFKVEGSLNTILAEILEIEIKAKEEGIKDQVHICSSQNII